MNEGLAQGPYVAAGVGFEPETFRTQGTEPTTEHHAHINGKFYVKVVKHTIIKLTLQAKKCK